jgi:hypothetical protein
MGAMERVGLQRRLRLTGPPLLSGQLDKEFARRRLRADYLLHLAPPQVGAGLLNHWEFQKKRERMGVRMSGYQTAAFEMHGVHVLSFVVNINDRSGRPWRLMREELGPLSRCGWVEFALPALVRTWERPIRSPLGVVFSYLVEDGSTPRGRTRRPNTPGRTTWMRWAGTARTPTVGPTR